MILVFVATVSCLVCALSGYITAYVALVQLSALMPIDVARPLVVLIIIAVEVLIFTSTSLRSIAPNFGGVRRFWLAAFLLAMSVGVVVAVWPPVNLWG